MWDVENKKFIPDDMIVFATMTHSGELIAGGRLSPLEYIPMQSTGLKDKNGIEIFEGDIIMLSEITKSTIRPRFFAKKVNNVTEFLTDNSHYDYMGNLFETEIIGNLYQNHELPEKLK